MATGVVKPLGPDATMGATSDARIAALRWDVIPWSLVLDIDAPTSEARDAPFRRIWLVFRGLGEITWPLEKTRIPAGCFGTSVIVARPCGQMSEYAFNIIAPTYEGDTELGNPTKVVSIRACEVTGLASEKSQQSRKELGLSWRERIELARDEEFVEAIEALAGMTDR